MTGKFGGTSLADWRRLQGFWCAALLFLTGGLTLREGIRITKRSTESNWLAGPGGYISLIGGLLFCFALWELILAARATEPVSQSSQAKTSFGKKGWATLIFLAVYLLLIPWIGFILGSGIFLMGSLRLLGCTYRSMILVTLATCLGMFFLFPALGISVPRGWLGF
jgi:hypothetical protein